MNGSGGRLWLTESLSVGRGALLVCVLHVYVQTCVLAFHSVLFPHRESPEFCRLTSGRIHLQERLVKVQILIEIHMQRLAVMAQPQGVWSGVTARRERRHRVERRHHLIFVSRGRSLSGIGDEVRVSDGRPNPIRSDFNGQPVSLLLREWSNMVNAQLFFRQGFIEKNRLKDVRSLDVVCSSPVHDSALRLS